MQADVEATPVVHPYVSQINETHWEFLTRRAREIGLRGPRDGKKLALPPADGGDHGPPAGRVRRQRPSRSSRRAGTSSSSPPGSPRPSR